MPRMLNLRQLEAFRALMLTGTTVQAAAMLGITQPVISRLISDLEFQSGLSLFVRSGGRLRATPEADILFAELERTFYGLDHLSSFIKGIRNVGGTLNILATMPMAHGILPSVFQRLSKNNPDLHITLKTVLSRDARAWLDTQQFDVALTNYPIDYPSSFTQDFIRVNAVCIMPPDHPLAARDVVTADDLRGVSFVAMPPGSRHRQKVDLAFQQSDVTPRILVEAQTSAIICEMVATGIGVSVVDEISARAFLSKGLVLRPFLPKLIYEFRILLPMQREMSHTSRIFIKHAREYVAEAWPGQK
ncbi:DNA-binding transcriptional LysR family regulator [Shinella sp. BE166]|nr:LysR substrate-binding domain-containing protein [Shinella lacus]